MEEKLFNFDITGITKNISSYERQMVTYSSVRLDL